MALITSIPNFFGSSAPSSVAFNNAAKAIATQIGGAYYDELARSMLSASGNLDATNISATPAFRNAQKVEQYSQFIMTSTSVTVAGAPSFTGSVSVADCAIFGPFITETQILSVSTMTNSVAGSGTVPPAISSINVYINNQLFGAVSFKTSSGGTAFDVLSSPMNIVVQPGDYMLLDYSASDVATTTSLAQQFSLLCKCKHTRV